MIGLPANRNDTRNSFDSDVKSHPSPAEAQASHVFLSSIEDLIAKRVLAGIKRDTIVNRSS